MRWKMLLPSALVAALSGAVTAILLVAAGEYLEKSSTVYVLWVAVLTPLAASIAGGIFVYRHTARRRALQGLLASIFTALAAYGILYACLHLF